MDVAEDLPKIRTSKANGFSPRLKEAAALEAHRILALCRNRLGEHVELVLTVFCRSEPCAESSGRVPRELRFRFLSFQEVGDGNDANTLKPVDKTRRCET